MEYSEGNVHVNGVKIHYYRAGVGGTPFVLLHGAADNGLCWTPVAERLLADYDIIMPDARGHGLSDRLEPGSSPIVAVGEMVGLIDELGLSHPIIMAHSMGAGTAGAIAAEYPQLPRAVILEDPPWLPEMSPEDEATRMKNTETLVDTFVAYQRLGLDQVISEGKKAHPLWSEAELRPWAAAKLQFDPELRPGRFKKVPYTSQVPNIRCPLLLVSGRDGYVTQQVAAEVAALWVSDRPFRHVRIQGAPHNIRRAKLVEFMSAVTGFLKEIST